MEQNPINNTQPNIATPVANNQATPSPQQTTENPQEFQPQYQQQLNPQAPPQQNTQQFTEQPIIINTSIYNKETFLQSFSEIKKKYIHILILAFALLAIFTIKCFFSDYIAGNAFVCGLLVGLIVFTISYIKMLKKSSQAREASDAFLYGSVCQPVTYFYNTYFTSYNPQSQARFFMPYQNIIAINEYEDIYVLTLKANVAVLIHKNGFNLGNAEFFKTFIQSRVPITTKIKFK